MLALALLALTLGPGDVGAPEDGVRFAPPAIHEGWDMREQWDGVWRRFQDRNGRPQLQGPLLQWSPELQRAEYELALAAAEQPMLLERDWNRRTRGARLYVHSDDEFSFFNTLRLKENVRMGRAGALGMRFDRVEVREIHSSLFRLNFAFPNIAGSGAFIEIRPVARFEKQDLDVEVALGWNRDRVARVTARLFSFDTFNNASDALARQRDAEQEVRVLQRNASLGTALEFELFAIPNVRAELFLGAVLPSRSLLDYADAWVVDFERTQSALLGGTWIEWALPSAPVWVGGSVQMVATKQVNVDLQGHTLAEIPERELRSRAYLLIHLGRGTIGNTTIELSASYRDDQLPRHTSEYGSVTRDRSWMGMARTTWMPTRVFGLELTYIGLDREADGVGDLAPFLSASNHRLVTRFAFAFDPNVRITFGVGWDLDDRSNRYDQGGMTLTARW
ncbi:hypothetical protein ACNOYE_26375 [Nannocystaceae bacterium ST9]